MSFITRSIRSAAIMALLTYASLTAVWGQATTSLRGIVSDTQGGAVDSANATLQNDQTGFKRSVVTDATGAYQFLQVPPGAYVVTIEKPGFSVSMQKDVQLAGEYTGHAERGFAARLGGYQCQRRGRSGHPQYGGRGDRQRF